MNTGTCLMRSNLDEFMNTIHSDDGNFAAPSGASNGWRHSHFCAPSDGGRFGAGALNFSPGWFQRLQDVSLLHLFIGPQIAHS